MKVWMHIPDCTYSDVDLLRATFATNVTSWGSDLLDVNSLKLPTCNANLLAQADAAWNSGRLNPFNQSLQPTQNIPNHNSFPTMNFNHLLFSMNAPSTSLQTKVPGEQSDVRAFSNLTAFDPITGVIATSIEASTGTTPTSSKVACPGLLTPSAVDTLPDIGSAPPCAPSPFPLKAIPPTTPQTDDSTLSSSPLTKTSPSVLLDALPTAPQTADSTLSPLLFPTATLPPVLLDE